ncbi:MAG: NADH-quinone oxidoreductase subunit C [Desulfarculus sp.]|jgi:NADH-quinone oxidoreductase subunit C|nr:MAG: NADH-quinone oxidoreductase subunit C [Desulfarculus sp.]
MSFLEDITPVLAQRFGVENLTAQDRARHGYDLRLALDQERLTELVGLLKEAGCYLEYITAVDQGQVLELLYFFGRYDQPPFRLQVKVAMPKGVAVPSLAGIIRAADWQEREVFDMFGQRFAGHPDLRRILLSEDADFHPLLKDFKPGPEHGGEVVNLERK